MDLFLIVALMKRLHGLANSTLPPDITLRICSQVRIVVTNGGFEVSTSKPTNLFLYEDPHGVSLINCLIKSRQDYARFLLVPHLVWDCTGIAVFLCLSALLGASITLYAILINKMIDMRPILPIHPFRLLR